MNPDYIRRKAEKMEADLRKGAIWMANNLTRIPQASKAPEAEPKPKKQRKPRAKKAQAPAATIKEGEVVVSFD
jgi:hypothetical protein